MTDNATNILNDWKRRNLTVSLDMQDAKSHQWPGTRVRVTRYDAAGKADIMANVIADDPLSALQQAHVQVLSKDPPIAPVKAPTSRPSYDLFASNDEDEPA